MSVHGEVTTYQLDENEHEQIKKQTPLHYIECKEKGMKDKDIAAEMGVKTTELYQMKSRWGFDEQPVEELKRKFTNAKRFRANNFNNVKPEERQTPEKPKTPDHDLAKQLIKEGNLKVSDVHERTGVPKPTLYKYRQDLKKAEEQPKKAASKKTPKKAKSQATSKTKDKQSTKK